MDLSEVTGKKMNRHPWELSRTQCALGVFSKYLDKLDKKNKSISYINAGAGDLYFDKVLMKKYKKSQVYAIDTAYKKVGSEGRRIHKYHRLEDVEPNTVDYAIMMDSLEYMEDDVEYVRKMTQRIKKGGFFFFTLPAYPMLFSNYDINIKNLRRYSRKSFSEVLRKVPELEKIEEHNFYTSLFMIRFAQKVLHLPIDPDQKFTSHWKYSQKNFLTGILTVCLNLDFLFNRMLSKAGIRLPGLSMIVICRKK